MGGTGKLSQIHNSVSPGGGRGGGWGGDGGQGRG